MHATEHVQPIVDKDSMKTLINMIEYSGRQLCTSQMHRSRSVVWVTLERSQDASSLCLADQTGCGGSINKARWEGLGHGPTARRACSKLSTDQDDGWPRQRQRTTH